jgi:hypothetical protein
LLVQRGRFGGLQANGYREVVTTDLEISTGLSVIGHVNYVSNAVVAAVVGAMLEGT